MLSRIGFQEHLPEFYISITQIKERDCAFPLLNMPQDYRQDQNDSHVYSQKVCVHLHLSDRIYKHGLYNLFPIMYLMTFNDCSQLKVFHWWFFILIGWRKNRVISVIHCQWVQINEANGWKIYPCQLYQD